MLVARGFLLAAAFTFCVSASIDSDEYCRLPGRVKDSLVQHDAVEGIANSIMPKVHELLHLDFFRYLKINLEKGCPFWQADGRCVNKACAVEFTEEEKARQMWNDRDLGAIEPGSFSTQSSLLASACRFTDKDFCLIDNDDAEGEFIDLPKNPERFTGYTGEASWTIWKAIYEQNCFKFVYGSMDRKLPLPAPSLRNTHLSPDHGLTDEVCAEKRAFYRVVSGMHSSISMHLCQEWLNKTSGEWEPNFKCFDSRVGQHKDRLGNAFFLYTVMLEAISKLEPYIRQYTWCSGDQLENMKTRALIGEILETISRNKPYLDVKSMFNGDRQLQNDFKEHFRNISRIMDCVGCEKCRLWGKIQVSGVGTALKILFSFDEESIRSKYGGFSLSKSELVTLFNAFGRFTESIDGLSLFRKLHGKQMAGTQSSLPIGLISRVWRKALSPAMRRLWTETFVPAIGSLHPSLNQNHALADLVILIIIFLSLFIGFRRLLAMNAANSSIETATSKNKRTARK